MKLKKKTQLKNNPGQPKLTCQTRNSSHEFRITQQKANSNKLWNSIPNQPSIRRWNWKKSLKKGHKKQHGLTCQTHDPSYETETTL